MTEAFFNTYPPKSLFTKKYKDLDFNGISGSDLLKEVSAKVKDTDYCHYDPLLNERIGIFGQASSSQTELKNNHVGPGDVFLFFDGLKNFSADGRDLHHLFGWLQIDKIIEGSKKLKVIFVRITFNTLMDMETPPGFLIIQFT